ncbi:DJ-1/PfpI family protein [Xanthomonas translucens]|uniref:DJ-1/PfpI family protein n=1 Tax=Xanthomonas campestris pv. translucens TaxID=343 RepID=UPI000A7327B7|nr:DJ-1/PfpI family protein [Xanthomonas translucens]
MIDNLNRRDFLALAAALSAAGAFTMTVAAQDKHAGHMMPPPDAPRITILVHPRMVMLDLIGPMTIFNVLGTHIDLVWKEKIPISTELGLSITPSKTFAEADEAPDVLFIPGGLMGTIDCMNDPQVMDFLRGRGEKAKWVTAICTGPLTLAATWRLKGYDATSNWVHADLLPLMGARHVHKRVVTDRNRMTGAGVTAGLDFGLSLAANLRGEEEARRVQLILEYAPEPPFDGGTQEKEPNRLLKYQFGPNKPTPVSRLL